VEKETNKNTKLGAPIEEENIKLKNYQRREDRRKKTLTERTNARWSVPIRKIREQGTPGVE
jgi:hypothetical protein